MFILKFHSFIIYIGCATFLGSIFYTVTYIIIVRLVMINIYIEIVLVNYDEAQEQEEIGVTKEDFDHFYSIWEKYD